MEFVELMLDMASVGPNDVVFDLGSGDGRIVINAAKRGAKSIGIETDTSLIDFAKRKRAEIRDYLKKKMVLKIIPFLDVKIDEGEKNRQKIDELLKNS